MNLDEVEARWRAGHILTSELPDVARQLVEGGHDVPALRRLAAAEDEDLRSEGRRTFERALRELGRGGMDGSEAALTLARGWALELVEHKLAARRAVQAIAHVRFRGSVDVDAALEPFSELDDAYEAVAEQRFSRLRMIPLDRRARREAQRLLA